jgi:murein DD-endopeptidase MepM/ murein hydrolase activator NlpD
MLGSFKLRILLVIVLLAILGLVMQGNYSSKQVVEPVLRYIMETDYRDDLLRSASAIFHRGRDAERSQAVGGTGLLHMPCEFLKVEQNYGWYWNQADNKQEFCPGIYLLVEDNTLVTPTLTGEVSSISRDENGGTVTVQHNDGFYSVYGGLKEVLVENHSGLQLNTAIGKTGEHFYFELRTGEGPLDPQSIFK